MCFAKFKEIINFCMSFIVGDFVLPPPFLEAPPYLRFKFVKISDKFCLKLSHNLRRCPIFQIIVKSLRFYPWGRVLSLCGKIFKMEEILTLPEILRYIKNLFQKILDHREKYLPMKTALKETFHVEQPISCAKQKREQT